MAEEKKPDEKNETPEPKTETVEKSQFDRAIADLDARNKDITSLNGQLAELQKANAEVQKAQSPDKYVTSLENEVERLKGAHTKVQTEFDTYKTNQTTQDVDRKKLGAFWEMAIEDGMQKDKDILNYVDKDSIQIDSSGKVNSKSVLSELNRIKKSKSYLFESKHEPINNDAPGEGEEQSKTKSFKDQGLEVLGLA